MVLCYTLVKVKQSQTTFETHGGVSTIGARGFGSIADYIAAYLRKLLEESPEGYIEIRRSDLAAQFRCVPSQITYVLATRFNARTGFLVESRRGGGGYVRIVKLPVGMGSDPVRRLLEAVGSAISQQEAEGVILRLREEEFITPREARLMLAVCAEAAARWNPPWRDMARADALRSMLGALLRENR